MELCSGMICLIAKSLSRAVVSWCGTMFHSIMNSPVEPCRVFLAVFYYHPCELEFSVCGVGEVTKWGREERLGALCVWVRASFPLDLILIRVVLWFLVNLKDQSRIYLQRLHIACTKFISNSPWTSWKDMKFLWQSSAELGACGGTRLEWYLALSFCCNCLM